MAGEWHQPSARGGRLGRVAIRSREPLALPGVTSKRGMKVAWRLRDQPGRVTPRAPAAEPYATAGVSRGLHVAIIRSANASQREYNGGRMPQKENSQQRRD
jgi:hypothetical protein